MKVRGKVGIRYRIFGVISTWNIFSHGAGLMVWESVTGEGKKLRPHQQWLLEIGRARRVNKMNLERVTRNVGGKSDFITLEPGEEKNFKKE